MGKRVITKAEDLERAYGYRCQAVWTGREMVRVHKMPTTVQRQEHMVLVREYQDGRLTLSLDGAQ